MSLLILEMTHLHISFISKHACDILYALCMRMSDVSGGTKRACKFLAGICTTIPKSLIDKRLYGVCSIYIVHGMCMFVSRFLKIKTFSLGCKHIYVHARLVMAVMHVCVSIDVGCLYHDFEEQKHSCRATGIQGLGLISS